MNPTLTNGKNVILHQEVAPRQGLIFVFRKPTAWKYMGTGEKVLIKRIAAAPGDTLTFDGKAFYVNGIVLYELSKDNYECAAGKAGYSHTLTKHEVFAMGDNALKSLDSRRIFCDGNASGAYIAYRNVIDFGTIERIF